MDKDGSPYANQRPLGMSWMAGLIKNIAIVERFRVQFRAEAFNALNRTQFSTPPMSPTAADFGKVTAQANWPCVVQGSLRLVCK